MRWDKINFAIKYIEEHLEDKVLEKEIELIVECSYSHFQKAFFYLTGISLTEYIRKRKLTQAAFDLQNKDEKVIDIALKYGYDSPTAFTRAFQKMFNMSPKEAKQKNKQYIAYSPLKFDLSLSGNAGLKYSILKKDSFKIIGRKITTNIVDHDYYQKIMEFWQENTPYINEMINYNNDIPKGILAAAIGEWETKGEFNYYIGSASTKTIKHENWVELELPASLWVVFDFTGAMPHAIRNGYKQIISDWFPYSGYKYRDFPDIELYSNGNILDKNYKTQIWIAIERD